MQHIKKIYLYLVSVIALVIMVIGAIMLLHMALNTWVFTKADNDYYYESYRCSEPAVTSEADKSVAETPKCTPEDEARMKQEQQERKTAQKQRNASHATAMILVASPVWFFHWRLARKES